MKVPNASATSDDEFAALASAPRLSAFDDVAAAPGPMRSERAERYQRGALLGVGGMGQVHLALDTWLGRQVAMKEIALVADPEARRQLRDRLRREARLAARLEHPAIVPIYDVDEAPDGSVFYVMRVVRGRSLAMALAAGEVAGDTRDRWLRAMLAVIEAVGYAHHAGVVHRDLKPANLMLGEFGEAQILDWGLAVEVDGEGFAPSRGAGTRGYMSPEQERGEDVDARSDVWSLGTILGEIVAAGGGEEVELQAVVKQATAPDRDARYPDAKALAADLAAWLDGRRVRAHSYSTWQLFVRVVRAWRVPIAVGVLALVGIAVAVGLGAAATERERARAVQAEGEALQTADELAGALREASRNLAQALLGEARTRARAGARPEAEVLAARALALFDDPGARGVLASFGVSPRPTRVARHALPPGCGAVTPSADGAEVLCTFSDRVERWQLAPLERRWSYPVEAQQAPTLLDDDTTIISAPYRIDTLDERGGVVSQHATTLAYKRTHSRERFGAVVGPWEVAWVDRGAVIEIGGLCLERGPVVVAAAAHPSAAGARWYTLCADGELRARVVDAAGDVGPALATGVRGAAAMVVAGEALVIGTNDGRLVWVEAATGRVRHSVDTGLSPIVDVQLSPDGRLVAVRGERGGVALFDGWTYAHLDRLPAGLHDALRFVGPRRLAVAGGQPAKGERSGMQLELWELPEPLPHRLDLPGGVTSIVLVGATSPSLISVAADARMEHWQWPPRSPTARSGTQWQTGTIKAHTLGRDALYTTTVGETGVRVLPVGDAVLAELGPIADFGEHRARRIGWVAPVPDAGARFDGWLVLLDYNFAVIAVPLHEGRAVRARLDAECDSYPLMGGGGLLGEHMDLAVAPGARHIAVLADREGVARRITARGQGLVVDREIIVGEAGAIALERDGDGVWVVGDDRLAAYSFEDGRLLLEIPLVGRFVELAVSDDDGGHWVAAGTRDGQTLVWRFEGGRLVLTHRFDDHAERVAALAFSADGQMLATGSWDRTVRLRALGAAANADALEAHWGVDLERALR